MSFVEILKKYDTYERLQDKVAMRGETYWKRERETKRRYLTDGYVYGWIG